VQATPDTLVELIKFGLILGSGMAAAVAVFIGFRKGTGTTKPVEGAIVSATLADGQAVRDLISALNRMMTEMEDSREQRHRDSMAERDAMHELTECIRRGGVPPNWLDLIGKLSGPR
jgi:hypothetical protein